MKGIIFGVFKEFLEQKLGSEVASKVKQEMKADVFLPVSSYPDELVVSFVVSAAKHSGKTADDIVFEFGRHFISSDMVHKIYHNYFAGQKSAKAFLRNQDNVHSALTSSMAGATPPRFKYEEPSENELVMIYESGRKLCTLVRGLIQGAAEYYNENVKIDERTCMKKGAPRCEFGLAFSKK